MQGTINFRGKLINYSNRQDFFLEVEQNKWERETFDVLDKFIVAGKTFVDIGGWIGILSIYANMLGAKVYAIEPDRVAINQLVENLIANDLLFDIVYSDVAISDKNGEAVLNSMTNGFGNSESSLIDRGDIYDTKKVTTNTLGYFLDSYKISADDICLIKSDTEGGEKYLFNIETIRTLEWFKYPPIFISLHPRWLTKESIDDFIKYFYPVYNITSVLNNKVYSESDILNAMNNSTDNSFILTKK